MMTLCWKHKEGIENKKENIYLQEWERLKETDAHSNFPEQSMIRAFALVFDLIL